jgi:hypothetical protein
MSLHIKAIDRLFERLAATYGAQWTRQWQDVPMADVKTAWAHELDVFSGSLHRLAWALENLPPKCPNVIEFKSLCRQAPAPEVPRLPEPKADPARIAAEMSKLGELRAKVTKGATQDRLAWARRIVARHTACERMTPTVLKMAKDALRFEGVTQ